MTALAVAASACAGSGTDKAGGSKPIVLTLATHDDDYAHESFAAAVRRLSDGSMRVRILNDWRAEDADYERGIVGDVRQGNVKLGIVGVRVWDTLGVNSFRALVAPLLVDSLALEARALQSKLAARAISRLRYRGVVGIALLPGRLRRPLGITRALVRPEDYAGATIGIRPGGVAAATFTALGATAASYVPGRLSGVDGTELDPATIVLDGYDAGARTLTTDVVLWPKAQTVVMNRAAFEALTSEQRELLRSAGRAALRPELERIRRDERAGLSALCRRRTVRLRAARSEGLVALREALRPVYEELERDPFTNGWIAKIAQMRRAAAESPQPLRCPWAGTSGAERSAASTLQGRWRFTKASVREYVDAGIPRGLAEAFARDAPSRADLVFENGRHRTMNLDTGRVLATGTYDIEGDVIRLVFESGFGVVVGRRYALRWSVFRDRLVFLPIRGEQPLQALTVKPFTRVQ